MRTNKTKPNTVAKNLVSPPTKNEETASKDEATASKAHKASIPILTQQEKQHYPRRNLGFSPNKLLTLSAKNLGDLAQLTGGEVGFVIERSRALSARLAITGAQVLSSFFRCASPTVASHKGEDIDVIHAFIVLGKKAGEPGTILIAEASGSGIKERELKLSELSASEELRLYQDPDPQFRKSFTNYTRQSIEHLTPETTNPRIKEKGVYEHLACLRAMCSRLAWGEADSRLCASAAADLLLGDPISSTPGKVRPQICSSFAMSTYSAAKLNYSLGAKTRAEFIELGHTQGREALANKLEDHLKKQQAYIYTFFQSKAPFATPNITPHALERKFRDLTNDI